MDPRRKRRQQLLSFALLSIFGLGGLAFGGLGAVLGFEYAHAAACPAGKPAPDCLQYRPARLQDVHYFSSKGGGYYRVSVTGPGWTNWSDFDSGVLRNASLYPGDPVTAELWRGTLTAITAGGVRYESQATHRHDWVFSLFGLAFILAGMSPWLWPRLRTRLSLDRAGTSAPALPPSEPGSLLVIRPPARVARQRLLMGGAWMAGAAVFLAFSAYYNSEPFVWWLLVPFVAVPLLLILSGRRQAIGVTPDEVWFRGPLRTKRAPRSSVAQLVVRTPKGGRGQSQLVFAGPDGGKVLSAPAGAFAITDIQEVARTLGVRAELPNAGDAELSAQTYQR